jgi:hypothetical protein
MRPTFPIFDFTEDTAPQQTANKFVFAFGFFVSLGEI